MNNKYFEDTYNAMKGYEQAKTSIKEMKEAAWLKYGYDSPEAKVWEDREDALKCPCTAGQLDAYRAWRHTYKDLGMDEILIVDDCPWEADIESFVQALRDGNVPEIILTDTSTALMRTMHALADHGCLMRSLCTMTVNDETWGQQEIQGVSFVVVTAQEQ